MNLTLNFCVIFGYLLASLPAIAQIVPDTTLPVRSNVTHQGNTSIITGGTSAGSNLFHSFEQFSVPTRGIVYFNNALNIQNIISRVTGGSVSNIGGLLKANGTANLFLISPSGFIIGPNASLQIGGSFVGSTASSIKFDDGTFFSAKTPETPPLLTISIPIGLRFGSNPGSIIAQGTGYNISLSDPIYSPYIIGLSSSGLQVKPGKTLAIIGGDVSLNGSVLTAPGGRIELGSVSDGLVSINPTLSGGLALGYQGVQISKDIQLSQQTLINASGISGGSIQLQGANIKLNDGSLALIQNQGNQSAGDINVNASESLELTGTSPNGTISSGVVNETVRGNGGNIGISTKKLFLQGGGTIITRTYSSGKGGDLTVNASESTRLLGASLSSLQLPSTIITAAFGSGNGGNLTLSTKKLTIQGGAEIHSSGFGFGKSGDITINVLESTQLLGALSGSFEFPSSITIQNAGFSRSGNIALSTGNLLLRDGGSITSVSQGINSGGNVTVNANKFIDIAGVTSKNFEPSIIQSTAFSSGASGNLTVNTPKLVIRDGGAVSTSTLASGNAGNLFINASNSIEVSGTALGSITSVPSYLASSAIILNKRIQQLYGLPPIPSGAAGSLTINTPKLSVVNGGLINVRNDGPGNAGTVKINARSIFLDKGSITAATASGEGGNIFLNAQNLQLRHNSPITATAAGGSGNGGNITINTGTLAALESSPITANAYQGRGGNIQINAQGIFSSPDSPITASSQLGINGTVQLNTLVNNSALGLAILPIATTDPTKLIGQGCPANVGPHGSKFIVTGSGGMPPSPSDLQGGDTVWTDLGSNASSTRGSLERSDIDNIVPSTEYRGGPLVEAQGWVTNSKGEVVFTAAAPTVTPDVPWLRPTGCQTTH